MLLKRAWIAACLVLFFGAGSSGVFAQTRCGGLRLETLEGQGLSEVLGAYASEACPLNALMWQTYRANPHAFSGSIQQLRADAVLDLPLFAAPDEAARREANRQIALQEAAFERYKKQVDQGLPQSDAPQPISDPQEARIRALEQQLAELKQLLKLSEPSQAADASQRPTASRSDSSAPPSERMAPAWLKTTEGMVLAGLLLTALGAGFILLWRMRTPLTPMAAGDDDPAWPPELRKARDDINRAAGRDAGLVSQTELERAVDGRFPLPNLDFVRGPGDETGPADRKRSEGEPSSGRTET